MASTVEKLNKLYVTDSLHDESQAHNFKMSSEGGPHRCTNFRSFHSGGANFAFGDGSVQYLSDNIDMAIYQALSTIRAVRWSRCRSASLGCQRQPTRQQRPTVQPTVSVSKIL
ncbi:MAG: DUF1559 domain-containing protein [Pirellulaceae bacterium]